MEQKIGVVIIDDSSQWLQRFEDAVGEFDGLTVLGNAGTSQDAIALVERLRPPILILDLSLAGSNGVDVLKALGSLGIDTKVVVVTGAPSAQLRAGCLNLGARYFLDKAFEFDQLRDALRTLMEEACNE